MPENMWNPWHGCKKISPGCKNCYVYYLDAIRDRDAGIVTKSKTGFNLPLKRDRYGNYKIPAGKEVATCFTSDFFLDEADVWRPEAWDIIRKRPDLDFFIITKRISRFMDCVPPDWGDGWDNVFINVTAENQQMADERIPILLSLPIKKKGIAISPMLEDVNIRQYLATGKILSVSVGGESYTNARECRFEWVQHVKEQCDEMKVHFSFHQTGTNFIYMGKRYKIPHRLEHQQAKKAFSKKTRKRDPEKRWHNEGN